MRFLILTKRSLLCAALIALSAVLVAAGLGRQYQTSSASNTGSEKFRFIVWIQTKKDSDYL